jgi:hypothetical protein
MTKRIDPDLFARLMKLPSETRTDLLEYLGQTPVSAAEALRLSSIVASVPRDNRSGSVGEPG